MDNPLMNAASGNIRKYIFTDETMVYNICRGNVICAVTLHRIKRLSDGKIGGWIEKEKNLSHKGNCWVDDEAKVFDNAEVYDNARVYDQAVVYDDAHVRDNAQVFGDAIVADHAEVVQMASVSGKTILTGYNCVDCIVIDNVYHEIGD